MVEGLKDVGRHIGTWGNGHYEAEVALNGVVTIKTVFDDPNKKGEFTVTMSRVEWDRLSTWVAWAQTHPKEQVE